MTGAWVSLAGSAGAVSRFMLDGLVRRRVASDLPWSTLLINVSGSLLLGILTGLVLFRHAPTSLTLVVGTGFCGGYTTFSTASFESVRLLQRRRYLAALASAFGTLLITVGAAALGMEAVRP